MKTPSTLRTSRILQFLALSLGFLVAGISTSAQAQTTITWATPALVTDSAVQSTSGSANITVSTGTWAVGDVIRFTGTTATTNPFGTTATRYYVVSVAGSTLQVSTTPGGTALNATNTTTNSTTAQGQDWLTGTNWTGGTAPNSNSTIGAVTSVADTNVPIVVNGAVTAYGLSFVGNTNGDLTLVSGANGTSLYALTFGTNDASIPKMTLSGGSNALIALGTSSAGTMTLKIAGTQGLIFNSSAGGAITGSGTAATSTAPGKAIRSTNVDWSGLSGGIQVERGVLQIQAASGVLPNQTLTVGNAQTVTNNLLAGLNLQGFGSTVDALNGNSLGRIYGASTLSVGNAGGTGNYGGVIGVDFTGATTATNLTKAGSGTQTISGIMAGTGNVTVNGGGMLAITGSSTYTGTTMINSGTLQAGSTTALSSASAVTLANAAGATLDLNGNNNTIGSLAGSGATGGNVTLGTGTLTTNGNNTSTSFAGTISGSGALTKLGTGSLTLSNSNNSYTGGTTINNGTIIQTAAGALGTGTITLGDGSTSNSATLQGNVSTTNSNAITIAAGGSGTYKIANVGGSDYNFSGPIALNNAATFQTTSGGAMFLSGAITGSSLITIDGGGTTSKFVGLNTSSAGTFTGNILVQNKGQLKFGNGATNALSTATTLTMDATSSMDTGLLSQTFAGLNDVVAGAGGSSVINNQGGTTLTLGGSGTYSFSGAISGAGGLTKSGNGTQTLSGSNTYGGTTSITSGTLVVNGSLNGVGAVAVSGGTLGGSGSIAGVTTVGSGATVYPGVGSASATTLSIGNNVVFNDGSTFKIDVGVGTSGKLASTGTLALNGTVTLTLSGTLDGSTNYVIATFASGGLTGTFTNIDPAIALAGYSVQYNNAGGQILLSVPEPGTWAMLVGGIGMLVLFRRRRA